MGADKDINGKSALSWKDADVSKIMSVSVSSGKKELLKSIKKIVSLQVKQIYGDKRDTKYRNIVDLIMLRINSNLDEFDYDNKIEIDSTEIINSICNSIEKAISKSYSNSEQMSLAKFVDAISIGLKDTKIEQTSNKSIPKHVNTEKIIEETIIEDSIETDNSKHDNQQQHKSKENTSNDELTSQSDNAKKESIKKQVLQNIQLNIDTQFNKLFNLCSISTASKLSTLSIESNKVNKDNKDGDKTISPINKQVEAVEILEKKQTNSINVIEKVEERTEKKDKKTSIEKIPSDIAQNNIYKYNKKIFKGLRVQSIVLTLGMINAVQKHAKTIEQAFMALPLSLAAGFDKAMKLSKKIYKGVHKSLIQRIIDYFKDKIMKKLLKPLKDKLIALIKKMMPKWLQAAMDTVKKFFNAVKSLFKMIIKGIKRAFKWLMKITKKVFNWFKKVFGKTIKLIKNVIQGIFKKITNILKWAAKFLRAIFKFIKNGIKYLAKLFKSSKIGKLFTKLGSKIKGAFNKVKGGIKKLGSKVKNIFSKGKNFFKNMFSKAKNAIKNLAKKVANTVKTVIKKVLKKVFDVVKNTVKKVVQKIMKRLGITIAKKVAKKKAQSLLMMGAKKILGFFKKWVIKFIAKLAAKILGSAAVNCIPILGQIISICMMIYTIVDTIIMFWDVYQFLKENPAAWDYMKEKVSEWASKVFDMGKKLAEFGKKLFRLLFIDGPKKLAKGYAHMLNLLANPFSSAKRQIKEARYIKELDRIKVRNFRMLDSMDPTKRAKFIKGRYKKNMKFIEKNRPDAESLTQKIKKEQDSWWPDNDDIMKWLDRRQGIFREMMERATELGLTDFSTSTCEKANSIVEAQEKKEAEMKRIAEELAKHRKEMSLKYGNKRIDIEALQKICKDQQDKQNKVNADIESFTKEVTKKAEYFTDYFQAKIDGEETEAEEPDKLDVAVI